MSSEVVVKYLSSTMFRALGRLLRGSDRLGSRLSMLSTLQVDFPNVTH